MPVSGLMALSSGYDSLSLAYCFVVFCLAAVRLPSACSVSLLEYGCSPRSFNMFKKIWVCRLSSLEVILRMYDMARGGLQVSLVGENKFESSLRLTPLMRRLEDPGRKTARSQNRLRRYYS